VQPSAQVSAGRERKVGHRSPIRQCQTPTAALIENLFLLRAGEKRSGEICGFVLSDLQGRQLALRVLGNRLENYLAIFLRIHFSPNLGNRPVRCDKESIALVEFHILESHQRDTIGSGRLAL
jgi:hypothetical protein